MNEADQDQLAILFRDYRSKAKSYIDGLEWLADQLRFAVEHCAHKHDCPSCAKALEVVKRGPKT